MNNFRRMDKDVMIYGICDCLCVIFDSQVPLYSTMCVTIENVLKLTYRLYATKPWENLCKSKVLVYKYHLPKNEDCEGKFSWQVNNQGYGQATPFHWHPNLFERWQNVRSTMQCYHNPYKLQHSHNRNNSKVRKSSSRNYMLYVINVNHMQSSLRNCGQFHNRTSRLAVN